RLGPLPRARGARRAASAFPPARAARREALIVPMLESIRTVERTGQPERHPGEVEETYSVLMREERNVERLLRHLDRSSATIQVKLDGVAREPGGRFRV